MKGAAVPECFCCQRQMVRVVGIAGGGTMTIAVDAGCPSKMAGQRLVGHLAAVLLKA